MTISVDGLTGISSTGNITTDGYYHGNGYYLTGITGSGSSYGDSNVEVLLGSGNIANVQMLTGNIIPVANSVYSLGNASNQWKDLWVSSSTIYINSIPISLNSNADLTVNGSPVVTASGANGVTNVTAMDVAGPLAANSISVSGNITSDSYFFGNAAFMTGIPAQYGDSNVQTYLSSGNVSNIVSSGNITSGQVVIANALSAGITRAYLTGNTLGTANSTLILDPQGDGSPTTGGVVVLGNLSVSGNLTYTNVNVSTTDNFIWQAANTANTPLGATGAGLSVGPGNTPYATWTYNAVANSWLSNIAITATGGANINGPLVGASTGTFSGNVSAARFLGNGASLSSITGANVTGTVANATYAVSAGLANNANIAVYANTAGSANTANTANTATYALNAGNANVSNVAVTVSANAQPNITSVGILSSLAVNGGTTLANASVGNTITFGNANLSLYGITVATGSSNLIIDPSGDGNPLTGNVRILGNLSVTGNVIYTNIGLGTTNSLVFIAANNISNANAISGTGGGLWVGANGFAQLTYDNTLNSWTTNLPMSVAGGVNAGGPLVASTGTFGGSVTAGTFAGDGSTLTNITANNINGQVANALVAGTVYSNAQPNITSVGTLTSLTSTGLVSTTGNISGSYVLGNGAFLTGLPAGYANSNASAYFSSGSANANIITTANVTGAYIHGNGAFLTGLPAGYGNANLANVGSNAIGTTGNVSAGNLSVTGLTRLGNVGNVTITGGVSGQSLITDGTGNLHWGNVVTQIPAVYFTAPIAGNNQSFSNVILGQYTDVNQITVFYNGSLLENTYYTLTGDTLTVNTSLKVGDTIDTINALVSGAVNNITSGYGNSNVVAMLAASQVGNIIPATDGISDLGEVAHRWGNINLAGNVNSNGLTVSGNAVISGNATILGNLTYNDVSTITTSNLVLGLGNNQTGINVTGGGMVVGNTNEASFRYNQPTHSWDSNLNISAAGNVIATFLVGDGSKLSNINAGNIVGSYGNDDVSTFLSSGTANANIITTANISGAYIIGNGSALTGLPAGYANSNVSAYFSSGSANAEIITSANVTADYFIGDGSQLTNLPPQVTVVPAVAFTAPVSGNNQTFSNVVLGSYAANTDITLFYNGALLPADYFTLSGDTLTINTPLLAGDSINVPQINVGNLTATITTGYGDSNVSVYLDGQNAGNIIPNNDLGWTLGNSTNRWKSLAVGNVSATGSILGAGLTITGNAFITGNANIQGTLTYSNISSLVTSNLVLGLGNNQTGINVSGGGIVVGNTNEATWLYNQPTHSWTSNIAISAAGNVTGAYLLGNVSQAAGLGNIVTVDKNGNATTYLVGDGTWQELPRERINWNTWINGANLVCADNLVSSGVTGNSAFVANYGYQVTNNSIGGVGTLYWQPSPFTFPTATPLSVKMSTCAFSPAGNAPGDGPFISIGGSTPTATPGGAATDGLCVWYLFYDVLPRIEVFVGNTNLKTINTNNPAYYINSTTTYKEGSASNKADNWYDFEIIIKPYQNRRYLEIRINGSMVGQVDVTAWTPSGYYLTAGARSGAATAFQYCRAFTATW